MVRTLIALSVVAMAAASLGCRMCASPFDYCGPTFTGQCGESCDRDYRAGSVLSGSEVYYTDDQQFVGVSEGMTTEPVTIDDRPVIQQSDQIRVANDSPETVMQQTEFVEHIR